MATAADRRRALDECAATLGLPPIAGLVQYGRTHHGARFFLELVDRSSVDLGTVDQLFNQHIFARRLFVAADVYPRFLSREGWWAALGALVGCKEVVEDDEILDDEEPEAAAAAA